MEYKKNVQLINKSYNKLITVKKSNIRLRPNYKTINNNKNPYKKEIYINKKNYYYLVKEKSRIGMSKIVVHEEIIPRYDLNLSNKEYKMQLTSSYYKYCFFEEDFTTIVLKKSKKNINKINFIYNIGNDNVLYYNINLKINNNLNTDIFKYFL